MTRLGEELRKPHLPALDGLRAIAAGLVIAYHMGYPSAASLGVLMFFVISGFLITWLLLKEEQEKGTISLRSFYIRRSLRIFPAFYAYWLLLMGSLLIAHKHPHTIQAICSFFYLNNYYQAIFGDPNTGLSHTWSLAIEEQFYLLWPFLFLLLKDGRTRLRFLWIAIGVIWVYREIMVLALHVHQGYVYEAFDMRADHLLIGCLLAVALFQGAFKPLWSFLCNYPAAPFLTIAILAIEQQVARAGLPRYRDLVGFIVEPVLIAILIPQLIAFRTGPITGWLETRWMRYLGRISYSSYLYQQALIYPIEKRLGQWPFLSALACVGAIILCASGSYFFIERPFLNLKAHYQRIQTRRAQESLGEKTVPDSTVAETQMGSHRHDLAS